MSDVVSSRRPPSYARRSLDPAVAALLAEARLEQGLTVAEAAAQVGISPRYCRQLEAGQRVMSTAVADRMCHLYELDGGDAEAVRSVALAGVGKAWAPQQPPVAAVEPSWLAPDDDDLHPNIRARIVRLAAPQAPSST